MIDHTRLGLSILRSLLFSIKKLTDRYPFRHGKWVLDGLVVESKHAMEGARKQLDLYIPTTLASPAQLNNATQFHCNTDQSPSCHEKR